MNKAFTHDGTILQYRKLVADTPYTITNKAQSYFMDWMLEGIFSITARIQVLFEEES